LNINHEFIKNFDIFLSNHIGLDEQMIVAITKSNVIYCLKGFKKNNFIELVKNEIGHAYTDANAYEVALFYLLIETIYQYNLDRGLVIVDSENINKIKTKNTGLLQLPTLSKQGKQKSIEIVTIETSTDKIVKYIFVFSKFDLVKIEQSVINEGNMLVTY
jgi:glutamate 5-kinase